MFHTQDDMMTYLKGRGKQGQMFLGLKPQRCIVLLQPQPGFDVLPVAWVDLPADDEGGEQQTGPEVSGPLGPSGSKLRVAKAHHRMQQYREPKHREDAMNAFKPHVEQGRHQGTHSSAMAHRGTVTRMSVRNLDGPRGSSPIHRAPIKPSKTP